MTGFFILNYFFICQRFLSGLVRMKNQICPKQLKLCYVDARYLRRKEKIMKLKRNALLLICFFACSFMLAADPANGQKKIAQDFLEPPISLMQNWSMKKMTICIFWEKRICYSVLHILILAKSSNIGYLKKNCRI